jgi:hypothetical protein
MRGLPAATSKSHPKFGFYRLLVHSLLVHTAAQTGYGPSGVPRQESHWRGGNVSGFDFQDPEVRRLRPLIFIEGFFSDPLPGGNLLQS